MEFNSGFKGLKYQDFIFSGIYCSLKVMILSYVVLSLNKLRVNEINTNVAITNNTSFADGKL